MSEMENVFSLSFFSCHLFDSDHVIQFNTAILWIKAFPPGKRGTRSSDELYPSRDCALQEGMTGVPTGTPCLTTI